jgi:hypothetical protein
MNQVQLSGASGAEAPNRHIAGAFMASQNYPENKSAFGSPLRSLDVTLDEFRLTLEQPARPGNLSPELQALWEAARGNWNAAHEIAQAIGSATGSWIHAYLHRQEGDLANAAYWYRRAGQPVAKDSLGAEWERIAATLF